MVSYDEMISRIRSYGLSISRLSRIIGKSRPTLYKYISDYCNGEVSDIDTKTLLLLQELDQYYEKDDPGEMDAFLRGLFGDDYMERSGPPQEEDYQLHEPPDGSAYFVNLNSSFRPDAVNPKSDRDTGFVVDTYDMLDTYKFIGQSLVGFTNLKTKGRGVRLSKADNTFVVDYERQDGDYNIIREEKIVRFFLEYLSTTFNNPIFRDNPIHYVTYLKPQFDLAIAAINQFLKEMGPEMDGVKAMEITDRLNRERKEKLAADYSWTVLVTVAQRKMGVGGVAIDLCQSPVDHLKEHYRNIFEETHEGDVVLQAAAFGPFYDKNEAERIKTFFEVDWEMSLDHPDCIRPEHAINWLEGLKKKKGLMFFKEIA